MAFFLIVPSVMIVSIILVHALAKRLGLQIYYTTLAAVAILSFMAIFATAFISPVVGKSLALRLGVIIFSASIIVTLANKFLIKKKLDDERRFTEEVRAAYAAEIQKDFQPLAQQKSDPLEKFEWGESDDTLGATNRYNEQTNKPDSDEKTLQLDDTDEEVFDLSDKHDEVVDADKLDETVDGDKHDEVVDADKLDETVDADKLDETVDADKLDETVDADKLDEVVDADKTNKVVDGDKHDEVVDGDKLDEIVDADKLDEVVDADKTNKVVDDDKHDETVDGDKHDEVVDADKTNKVVDADKLDETVDGDKHDETVDGDKLDETVDDDKHDETVDADKHDETVDADKTDETVDADKHDEIVDADKHDENIDGNKLDETVDGDKLDETVDGDKLDETVDADKHDETVDADKHDETVDTDKHDEIVDADKHDETVDGDKLDEVVDADLDDSEPLKEFPLDKVFKPLSEVKPEEADKPIEVVEKPDPADNFPLDEVFEPLPEVKPEEADKPIKRALRKKRTELFPLQEVFEPLSLFDLDKIEELTQEQKSSATATDDANDENTGTLDDILDKAYSEREKGHVWQAIELYQTALERYRNDEYAPFVVIDLGNIYKEQALYSKAIKIYDDALSLPAVKRNPDIRKEFVNNLQYLRVIRDVLLKYQASSKPFGELPQEILQEIDTTFQKVQNLGASG